MYGSHHSQYGCYPHVAYPNPGLVGVFGGLLGLSTTMLQGSARMVRTIVEGTMWYGCHDYDAGPCHTDGCGCGEHARHYYQVEYWPCSRSRYC